VCTALFSPANTVVLDDDGNYVRACVKAGEKRGRALKRRGAAVFTIMSDFTSSAVVMTLGCMALQLHLCAKGLACGLFVYIYLLSRVCALVYLTTRQR
jgi:hypothetical protein